jgi:hypothetical protein
MAPRWSGSLSRVSERPRPASKLASFLQFRRCRESWRSLEGRRRAPLSSEFPQVQHHQIGTAMLNDVVEEVHDVSCRLSCRCKYQCIYTWPRISVPVSTFSFIVPFHYDISTDLYRYLFPGSLADPGRNSGRSEPLKKKSTLGFRY